MTGLAPGQRLVEEVDERGAPHGRVQTVDASNLVVGEERANHGRMVRDTVYWHPNGIVAVVEIATDANHYRDTMYDDSGLMISDEYLREGSGIRDGVCRFWTLDGEWNDASSGSYVDGVRRISLRCGDSAELTRARTGDSGPSETRRALRASYAEAWA